MAILNLKKIFEALHQAQVRYILIGGNAAIAHGMNHVTSDVDFCYERSPQNYSAIVRALKDSKPKLRIKGGSIHFLFDETTLKSGLNFTFDTEWGDIDLLGELEKIGTYFDLLPKAITFEFYEIPVKTISLDDLVKAKKIAGRTKDKLHLLELEAIQDILNNQKKKPE